MHTYHEKTFWYGAEHKTETTIKKTYDVWQKSSINKIHWQSREIKSSNCIDMEIVIEFQYLFWILNIR